MLIHMSSEYIHYASDSGKGIIEFYNSRGNALTSTMLREIRSFIEAAKEDDSIDVLLIRSGGDGAFCGGASLDELNQLESVDELTYYFMGIAQLLICIRACPKPIIVRVHGKTVGGGLGIVATADLTFATTNASVRLSELSIGLGPFVIGSALERKIGIAALSELTYLSSSWKKADWAKQKGLFTELYISDKELDAEITKRLNELQSFNKEALISIKKMLWQLTPDWEKELRERAALSAALWVQKKTR